MSRREPQQDAGEEPELVVLGLVAGSHALQGEVRVRWYGDGPDNLARAAAVWLAPNATSPARQRYDVVRAGSGRPGEIRLGLEGVTDRDSADALRGSIVFGAAEALAPLAPDEFYWHELVGCEVFDEEGGLVGVVEELWETGAHDLLVVAGRGARAGERHLLPTARELMPEIDVAARRIVVRAVPGLLDAPIGGAR